MPYSARLLPHAEWGRITEGSQAEKLAQLPDTDLARIVVVEDAPGGTILAYCVLVSTIHAGPIWVTPDARGNAAVDRALLSGMLTTLQAGGVGYVFTLIEAGDPTLAALADHGGFEPLPYVLWGSPVPPRGV